MERWLMRSCGLKTIGRYVELMRSAWQWRGIQGNWSQLGGDFIIDSEGIVRLAYRGHDPTDRPPVDDLLSVLRELRKEQTKDG